MTCFLFIYNKPKIFSIFANSFCVAAYCNTVIKN